MNPNIKNKEDKLIDEYLDDKEFLKEYRFVYDKNIFIDSIEKKEWKICNFIYHNSKYQKELKMYIIKHLAIEQFKQLYENCDFITKNFADILLDYNQKEKLTVLLN